MIDPYSRAYLAINKPGWSHSVAPKVLAELTESEAREKKFWESAVILLTCLFLCGLICLFFAKPVRADMVSVARSEIGHGEMFGNNRGFYVRQYLGGKESLPWCAGFVSYCAKKSGLNIPYTLRAKDFLRLGKKVSTPQVGDLIIFSRQGGGHIGIVEEITENTITTIEGNIGKYPSKVKEVTYYKKHIKDLLGFVRIN